MVRRWHATPFDDYATGRDAGEAFADRWAERLSEDGHDLTIGNRANLAYAGALVALFDSLKEKASGASPETIPGACHALPHA